MQHVFNQVILVLFRRQLNRELCSLQGQMRWKLLATTHYIACLSVKIHITTEHNHYPTLVVLIKIEHNQQMSK